MAQHNDIGMRGELTAQNFLLLHGFTILDINYRFDKAEVDIIAREHETLVFIEVKTRSTLRYGEPYENVTRKKQILMTLAANAYIDQTGWKGETRFDVVSIVTDNEGAHIEHIRNAFYPYQTEQ